MPHFKLRKRLLFSLLFLSIPLVTFLLLWLTPAGGLFENRRFEKYTDERFRQEACSSAINLHYTLSDPSLPGFTITTPPWARSACRSRRRKRRRSQRNRQILTVLTGML